MHTLEPFYGWEKLYSSSEDRRSPFAGKQYNYELLTNDIYGYYIHPAWDFIGYENLYIKILFVDYRLKFAIIEFIGEWNDALHNDVMHLKRNIVDILINYGICKYLLVGENILNFHGFDDCYYEEWFEDVDDGWIVAIGFRGHVLSEWRKYGIDCHIHYGGELEQDTWRTHTPHIVYSYLSKIISHRLSL